MSRPPLELAGIVRQHGAEYRSRHALPRDHLRLLHAIEVCRTAALGGHVERCGHCQHERISYNSCRNRHCPKCQSMARAQWLAARQRELLPVEYFHVVFTLPEQIAAIAFHNKKAVYNILFQAAAQTLLTIAGDPKHLGAHIGFFAILHTWGQNLQHHPHLHCVVPGGGLSLDRQQWIDCRPGFFLPVRVLSRLFRRLFLKALRHAYQKGQLNFYSELQPLQDPAAFRDYLAPLKTLDWVVYAKPPFGGPHQVLEYLGRYTHRVAISNQRLRTHDGERVSFSWKDYRHHNKTKTMSLTAEEFLRRFLLHALPRRFQRIRHYGLLANRHRRRNLALCRHLLSVPEPPSGEAPPSTTASAAPATESFHRCPLCGGPMSIIQLLRPAWSFDSS